MILFKTCRNWEFSFLKYLGCFDSIFEKHFRFLKELQLKTNNPLTSYNTSVAYY
jgi:hypothetical protein